MRNLRKLTFEQAVAEGRVEGQFGWLWNDAARGEARWIFTQTIAHRAYPASVRFVRAFVEYDE